MIERRVEMERMRDIYSQIRDDLSRICKKVTGKPEFPDFVQIEMGSVVKVTVNGISYYTKSPDQWKFFRKNVEEMIKRNA